MEPIRRYIDDVAELRFFIHRFRPEPAPRDFVEERQYVSRADNTTRIKRSDESDTSTFFLEDSYVP